MRIRRRWRRLLKAREEGREGGACFSSGRRWAGWTMCMEIGTCVLVPVFGELSGGGGE